MYEVSFRITRVVSHKVVLSVYRMKIEEYFDTFLNHFRRDSNLNYVNIVQNIHRYISKGVVLIPVQ